MLEKTASKLLGVLPESVVMAVRARIAVTSQDQRSAGHAALTAFSLRVAGAAIAYLSQILLARWMGIFDYGVFVVVYVWITVLSQIGNLGFSSSVIRFVPEYLARGESGHLAGVLLVGRLAAVAFATTLSAAGVALLLLFPGVVDQHYVIPILLGAVCLPLFCLTEVQDGIARSFAWPGLAFGPTYIWRPTMVLSAMAIAYLAGAPMTAATACIATIVGAYLTALIQLLAIRRRIPAHVAGAKRNYAIRTWIAVSLPILLADGFYALLTSIDVVMVARFMGPEDVAVYFAATKTLALVHFVYYAVRAASGPRFSYHFHGGDGPALRDMVRNSVRWTFWCSVVVSIAVLSTGELLLSLFGTDFTGGVGLMVILVVGILARASIGPVETLLTMAGYQKTCAAIFGVAFLVNVALNVLLIPHFGLFGAATATAVALSAEAVMVMLAVRSRFGFAVWVFRLDLGDGTTARRPRSAAS